MAPLLEVAQLWKELRNPDCSLCNLHKGAQWICLIGRGNPRAEVMFIGEAPGQREDDIGKPFAGRAGQVLDLILGYLDLDRAAVYITNAAKCRPPDNRDPTPREVNTCSNIYLAEEIRRVKPRLIVCLGRYAALAVLGTQTPIERTRRVLHRSRWEDIPMLVTYHPAICFYPGKGPKYGTIIADDIKWGLKAINEGETTGELFVFDDTMENLELYRSQTGTWAFDVETNEKDTFDPDLRIVSAAASPKFGVAVFQHGEVAGVELGRTLLTDPSVTVVGHSIKSDLKWIRRRGLKRKEIKAKIRDTLVMASLGDENYPNRKLQHLAVMRLEATPWKNKADQKGVHSLSLPELRVYNGKDTIWDRKLYFHLLKDIKKQGLEKILELDMHTIKTLTEVELHGMQIDQKTYKELCETYNRKVGALRKKVGVENPESPQQISAMLFDQLGIVPLDGEERGKSGYYSTREDVLLRLQGYKAVRRTLRYRMYATRKKMFLDGLDGDSGILHLIDKDWRIHPTYNVAKVPQGGGEKDDEGGTTSGRLSCKHPNLQQTPRKQEDIRPELNIKRMYISRWPHGEITAVDYRQGEVYLAASESGDPTMLRMLESGEDFHKTAAAEFTKKDPKNVTEFERKKAKAGVFGKLYRAGPPKLARSLNIELSEAEQWWRGFTRMFKVFERWAQEVEEEILEQGWTRIASGRIRHVPGATRGTPEGRELIRSAINARIQGLLGDITKNAMNLLSDYLYDNDYKSRVCGNIHDEVLVDTYPGERDHVLSAAFAIFEDSPTQICKLRIPLIAEAEVGPNWLEVKSVERGRFVSG